MGLEATGRNWAIATPHAAATEAGAQAFERGGNAVDAALAAAVTLAVVYPHNCGVGGDLFAVVQSAPDDGGEILTVRSSGRSPRGADPEALRAEHGTTMPLRGPGPITVPGAVAGWEAVHRFGAALPWRDAFETAIAAADDGFPLPDSIGEWHRMPATQAAFGADPGMAALFYPGGVPLGPGALVRQPALARTLEALAAGGAEALYTGPVGAAYVAGLRAVGLLHRGGGPRRPRGHRAPAARSDPGAASHVRVAPPTSQGYSLLQILAAAERLGLDPDPSGADAGVWARVFLAAARDVRRHLADPDRMHVHPATLLSDGHLAGFCDEVEADLLPAAGPPKPGGDTIALVTADGQGRAVSLIQSLFHGYGAGILEPTTGIIASDRGACFTLEPDHPGTFAPGTLPPHTLLPALVHDERGLAAVAGTMGGYQQPQIDAQVLAGVFALDRSAGGAVARAALDRGRPARGRRAAGGGRSRRASGARAIAEAIEAAGFAVQRTHDLDDTVGHAQVILAGRRRVRGGFRPASPRGRARGLRAPGLRRATVSPPRRRLRDCAATTMPHPPDVPVRPGRSPRPRPAGRAGRHRLGGRRRRRCAHLRLRGRAPHPRGARPRRGSAEPASWADRIHPADRARVVGRYARVASAGGRFDEEYRMRAATGDRRLGPGHRPRREGRGEARPRCCAG